DNIIEIIVIRDQIEVPNTYESVVIGSGFGGTIISLSIAKKYDEKNKIDSGKRRICILERGQWWISHEIPQSLDPNSIDSKSLRSYLVKNNMPFNTWSYPNNIKGMLTAIGNSRAVNPVEGLYEFKRMKNVNIISGSGVGGGSLVYFNITEKPDRNVYENWPTEHDGNASLDEYFPVAEQFIGVNAVTTISALSSPKFKLSKAKVFQDAAKGINKNTQNIMNISDLDAKLSITDISSDVFNPQIGRPNEEDVNKYSSFLEKNICQRQGRCGLGCIPGARHTLNKQIANAINREKLPLDVHPLCEVLEIYETGEEGNRYAVKFLDYRDIIDNDDFSPTRELSEQERTSITKIIKTNVVILSAGTLGSTEILLKSKKLNLSGMLGKKFSTNGDLFGVINPTKYNVDSTRGPTQTSIALFKDNDSFTFSIEDVGIPEMFADVFATIFDIMKEQKGSIPSKPFIPNKSFTSLFTQMVLNNIHFGDPETRDILSKLIKGLDISTLSTFVNIFSNLVSLFSRSKLNRSPEERVSNILVLFGIGRDVNQESKLLLNEKNNRIDLDADYNLDQPIYEKILNGMKMFAREIGKEGENSLIIPLWDTHSKTQISAHPIGGCSMSDNASDGVVDSLGRVFNGKNGTGTYSGLYVADGSIIPTSLGVNPSLTISALAFRIASHIEKILQ
ncbi:MAG TPA: GMC family oxidoreductase, partial [Nitrososphaeraceae archaeon]|nr:GMC family oxidoreductase [Nitrososphaeraceae archaeon]